MPFEEDETTVEETNIDFEEIYKLEYEEDDDEPLSKIKKDPIA